MADNTNVNPDIVEKVGNQPVGNFAEAPGTSPENIPEPASYRTPVVGDDDEDNYSTADEDGDEVAKETIDTQKVLDERKAMEDKLTNKEREELRDQATRLKDESNKKFQHSEFVEARDGYSRALDICPLCYSKDRSVLYSNRAACLSHLEDSEQAIKDCSESLTLNPDYMKPLKRRAELYEKTEKLDESLEDYKNILEKDPRDRDAILAVQRLPPLITERNEKLKTEMMGKLKDLGNLVLKPFGLSTDNFQLQQNEAGGYSVNFNK